MAIFEKTSQNKAFLDDTEKLFCIVENAQNINKHTEYILRVQRGPNKDNKWNVSRRYSDFAALHGSIQQASIELPLPPKKLIGNMQPSFIAERQIALQAYINEVLKHQVLVLSLQVRSFLDPNNYSLALAEQALQTVSIALRGEGRYELKGPLPDIGWRIRKHYFLVEKIFEIGRDSDDATFDETYREVDKFERIGQGFGSLVVKSVAPAWQRRGIKSLPISKIFSTFKFKGKYVKSVPGRLTVKVMDTDSRTNCTLSWQNYGPDRYLCDKDLQTAFKSLQNLSNIHLATLLVRAAYLMISSNRFLLLFMAISVFPEQWIIVEEREIVVEESASLKNTPFILLHFVGPRDVIGIGILADCWKSYYEFYRELHTTRYCEDEVLAIHNLETGAYVVRRIHENGSVRDLLYGTEYSKNHLAKYGNPKVRKPFTTGQIAHYGYQILQAIKFLQDKGIPHGHIHPGNIAIGNQKVQLLDVENALMGAPCLYRPYLLELRRAAHADSVDVYCFGRTLYEIAFASPLDQHYCDNYPDGVSQELETVLRLCLSSTSCKHGGPTTLDLLYHPFFTRCTLNGITPRDEARALLKFPLALKEELRSAAAAIEERLRRDQKLVRSAKREVRIKEILNSEEELRKQKRRARKRESVWKSTSSLGDAAPSHSASTTSSPTPPVPSAETNGNGSHTPAASPSDARSALLGAICGFDKNRLTRINSR